MKKETLYLQWYDSLHIEKDEEAPVANQTSAAEIVGDATGVNKGSERVDENRVVETSSNGKEVNEIEVNENIGVNESRGEQGNEREVNEKVNEGNIEVNEEVSENIVRVQESKKLDGGKVDGEDRVTVMWTSWRKWKRIL